MKKGGCVVVRSLSLGFFILLASLGACLNLVWAAEPIRMGMVASISGWGGFVGSQQKDAVLAIVEEINRKGGVLGRPIEVLIEDDKSTPTNAVIAATKLVRDLKVVALIGPTLPDSGMAMIPTAEQEKVPFVVGVPLPGEHKKWVFHLGPSEETTAEATLDMAVSLTKGRHIALIYEGTHIGRTGNKIFSRDIARYPGASLVAKETFEITDTSMVSQMTKIKASKPDVLVVYAGGSAAAIIARNYKQLGMATPVVTANVAQGPDFVKLGGQVAEEAGWIIPVWKMSVVEKLPVDDPFRKTVYEPVKKLFQDKYGKDKQFAIYHAPLVDCVNIVSAAIRLAGSDNRAAVRDALEKVRYEGLISPYACTAETHRGAPDAKAILIMAKLKNGDFVPFTP
jgi:branched-chain amino acid transport system substrate-binding protein